MSAGNRKHLLAVTVPAFGHVIPLTGLLTKVLDSCPDVDVTLVVSACKKDDVLQRGGFASRHLPGRVTIFPLEDGLPSNIETMMSASHLSIMKEAMDGPLTQLLQNMPVSKNGQISSPTGSTAAQITRPVNGVIFDIFVGICGEICKERSLPSYCFLTAAASMIPAMFFLPEDTPAANDEVFFKPQFDEKGHLLLPKSFLEFFFYCKKTSQLATEILINSFRELEADVAGAISMVPQLKGIPVRFIGPILPENQKNETKNQDKIAISEWLNKQENRSVVYISFGSMVFPEVPQLKSIAEGLLQLKKPFIWSLRSALYEHLPEKMQEEIAKLSSGYRDAPFLVIPWAPQQDVLAHPAVKVFVSHCGWNGTLETLSNGIPVVAWPMFGDQHPNAGFLAKDGLAIQIPGTGLKSDRLVPPEELTNAILQVGGWSSNDAKDSYFQTAQQCKKKANAATVPGGKSDIEFQSFVETLKKL
jgi:hypothetical protein